MIQTFAEILILLPTALAAGFLLTISEIIQKVMNDLDESSFKNFLTTLEYRAKRSPFALLVLLTPSIVSLPYWIFYGFDNWWFTAGLIMWFLASSLTRILNIPIYKKVKKLTKNQAEELKEQRSKLQVANRLRAWLTVASVVLMVIGIYQFSF